MFWIVILMRMFPTSASRFVCALFYSSSSSSFFLQLWTQRRWSSTSVHIHAFQFTFRKKKTTEKIIKREKIETNSNSMNNHSSVKHRYKQFFKNVQNTESKNSKNMRCVEILLSGQAFLLFYFLFLSHKFQENINSNHSCWFSRI